MFLDRFIVLVLKIILKKYIFLCISEQKAIVTTLSNTSWSFDDDITGIVKKISAIWI